MKFLRNTFRACSVNRLRLIGPVFVVLLLSSCQDPRISQPPDSGHWDSSVWSAASWN